MSEILTKSVYDCATGQAISVPLTEEELAQRREIEQKFLAQQQAEKEQEEAQRLAKESAIAKLSALGLSPEEITALTA